MTSDEVRLSARKLVSMSQSHFAILLLRMACCFQGAAVTDPAPAKKESAAKKQAAKKEQKEQKEPAKK